MKRLWYVGTLLSLTVHAARPLNTDDARLTDAGNCQLESWTRQSAERIDYWVLPACNFSGNLEVSLGAGRAQTALSPPVADYVMQAKTIVRPLTANDWGWGWAIGRIVHPASAPGPNGVGNTYAYVPASLALQDDRWVFHLNLGALRDAQPGRTAATWGVGSEWQIHPRWQGVLETYGDSLSGAASQVGLRWTVVPGCLQVDATVGRAWRTSPAAAWRSLGVRWTPRR